MKSTPRSDTIHHTTATHRHTPGSTAAQSWRHDVPGCNRLTQSRTAMLAYAAVPNSGLVRRATPAREDAARTPLVGAACAARTRHHANRTPSTLPYTAAKL